MRRYVTVAATALLCAAWPSRALAHPPHEAGERHTHDERPVEHIHDDGGPSAARITAMVFGGVVAAGLIVGGSFVVADGVEKREAIDRGRLGHMTQEEAGKIEDSSDASLAGGGILLGLGGLMAIGVIIGIVKEASSTADPDRSETKPLRFGVAPVQDGGIVILGGHF